MNTPIFTRALRFSNIVVAGAMLFTWLAPAHAEWKLDFSRRAKSSRDADLQAAGQTDRSPASAGSPAEHSGAQDQQGAARGVLENLFDSGEPVQDLVVLHTERGFVPATLRVRKNGRYRIHVVNVNEKEKNVSFILDGFSEHHATFYGKIKTFQLEPRKEGTFAFQSPETSAEGKLHCENLERALFEFAELSLHAGAVAPAVIDDLDGALQLRAAAFDVQKSFAPVLF